jgi:hypothetical protein
MGPSRELRRPTPSFYTVNLMICPHCNGKGMIVGKATFHHGPETTPTELTEINPCPHCHNGHQHCCEGDRAVTVIIAEECNPNGD